MFDLPMGIPVEEEVSVADGAIQPFDHGVISTWIGKRKTPAGHRLVRAGRIVAWIAEAPSGKSLLAGPEAKVRLEEIEAAGQSRLVAYEYSMAGLGIVGEIIPESFEFQADRQGLIPRGDIISRLLSRDLSSTLQAIAKSDVVRGAIAVDAGMLIDSVGELPGKAEDLAIEIGKSTTGRKEQATGLGFDKHGHWTLHSEDGALLLAQSGEIAIAVWTEAQADHTRLINSASATLEGEVSSRGFTGELPDGFVLREGKGGPDALMSFIEEASRESVTGHIKAGATDKAVSLVISGGVPVALYAPLAESFEDAMLGLTEAKRVIRLHRLPAGTILTKESGTVADFSLAHFRDLLCTLRTRSESRRANLMNKFDSLLGFDLGVEILRDLRAKSNFKVTKDSISKGLPQKEDDPVAAVDAGLRRRLEAAELQVDELLKDKASLQAKLDEATTRKTAAQVIAREASENRSDQVEALELANSTLNTMQVDLAQARGRAEDAEERSERLVKRVNELEHQLSSRASELAKALGEASSSAQLREDIEELALKEATLNSNLSAASEKLSSITKQTEDDERRLRVLQEQVSAARDRHSRAQAEAMIGEENVQRAKAELEQIEEQSRTMRRRGDDYHNRLAEDEARRSQVQAELRELMEERRQLLRELGDLGAKRGHAEAELSSLIDKAENLSQAHEEALADIEEAQVLRARLADEPLAQALLDESSTFEGLGPVLERLEAARGMGYSVTLLDRAVERSLQVIQSTVDHVASTPRHLLSSEVMTLLERQVPQTAGAVRGLARWSVQQRLEHQLGETVGHLVLDLEHLLEDYDRSITMLRRMRNVLEQLTRLGAPPAEVDALLANCKRPEALPSLAKETRRLIQVALDDIYLEADQRDAGEAVALEQTAKVLEELITQLDASGLADGIPRGALWEFQRDGLLPYERESVPAAQRTPVEEEMISNMEPSLAGEVPVSLDASVEPASADDDGWEELAPPVDEEVSEAATQVEIATPLAQSLNEDDERAQLEAELARLDAAWDHRQEPVQEVEKDPALVALEARLSNLDM